jgi:hypothetical protein
MLLQQEMLEEIVKKSQKLMEEKKYFVNKLNSLENNPKEFWKTLENLMNPLIWLTKQIK